VAFAGPAWHHAAVTTRDLVEFIRRHKYAVEASMSSAGGPQAAVVGIIVNHALELFFDTHEDTRKVQNLRSHPRVAFVIGWDQETVQYEGVADEPQGDDLMRMKRIYFERFPDGRERERWPGIVYVRVRPTWIRYSDFRAAEARIIEFGADQLDLVG
jgi:general stress protein 26